MQHFSKISLLALALVHFSTYPMYVNGGYMSMRDCNMSAVKLVNTGTIQGVNSVNLEAKSLSGNGIIEAPNITITCDEFEYSGVIACDKQCIIYVKKAFDAKMFKRSGKGTFKVVVSSPSIERCISSDLSTASYNYFCSKGLYLDQDEIDNTIKEMRAKAVLNDISDKAVLKDIKNNLGTHIRFHRERLEEKRDPDSLYLGLDKCRVTAVGLCVAYALFKNKQYLTTRFGVGAGFITSLSALLAGVSAVPAVFSCADFYYWINPRHKEKYNAFSLITSRIDHALKTEIF